MDRDDAGDLSIIPSSPSATSSSSSDLDTESTGSFFHDRSTTLGTLMGVSSFADVVPPRILPPPPPPPQRRRRRRPGRSWWRLCKDDMGVPTSLGDFLQLERRLGEHFLNGSVEHGGAVEGRGRLFQDGRVLPPAAPPPHPPAAERRGQQGRLPVLFTGICSGGDG